MTVNEMHIAIQQGVDKINSLQADMLLPEEIDIELNKSQMKFIQNKYNPGNKYGKGFEESQRRIDDIRVLLTEASLASAFKEQLSSKFFVDTVTLPGNYMHMVNQRSRVKINDCNPISFDAQNLGSGVNYFEVPLSVITLEDTGFIHSLVMMTNPTDLTTENYLNTTIWEIPDNVNFPQDINFVIENLLNPSSWAEGISIYWEQFGELETPDSFIVIVNQTIYPQFNWDASITNPYTNTNIPTSLNAVNTTNEILTYSSGNLITIPGDFEDDVIGASRVATEYTEIITAQNKFVQQDDIFTLLHDPFNTTKHTKPLTTIRNNNIDIYTNDIFITDSVELLYIREPAEISLSLGVNCELPIHTHQEIVDMSVASILEGISDPRYKTQALELGKNE